MACFENLPILLNMMHYMMTFDCNRVQCKGKDILAY